MLQQQPKEPQPLYGPTRFFLEGDFMNADILSCDDLKRLEASGNAEEGIGVDWAEVSEESFKNALDYIETTHNSLERERISYERNTVFDNGVYHSRSIFGRYWILPINQDFVVYFGEGPKPNKEIPGFFNSVKNAKEWMQLMHDDRCREIMATRVSPKTNTHSLQWKETENGDLKADFHFVTFGIQFLQDGQINPYIFIPDFGGFGQDKSVDGIKKFFQTKVDNLFK